MRGSLYLHSPILLHGVVLKHGDWINLAQGRDQWWNLVNMVLNLQVT
jgi:hypothetical protein